MKTAICLCFCAASVAACDNAVPEAIDSIPLASPAGPVTLIREATGSDQDGYDLFGPARPIPLNNGVWLLDSGNDQLVRFDSTLAHARSFGREGEGPGEIQFAMDMALDEDRLLVAEIGNGRISTFDTTGAFRSTLPASEGPNLIASVRGHLVTTLRADNEYAYRIDSVGRLTPYASIPEPVRKLARSDRSLYLPAGPYMAASDAGDLFVLDQSVLAIVRFDDQGGLVGTSLLPEPFRGRLLERRIRVNRAFAGRAGTFVDSPAAKRIYLDRDGRLLVLFSLEDSWGLIIDTGSWTARPLMLPDDRRLRDILWATGDAALDGDRLYVVSGSQLYQFTVEDWR
jgi:hypothetical protein